MPDDKERWISELKSSSRPKKLVASILKIVDAIDAIYDDEISKFTSEVKQSNFASPGVEFVSVKKVSAQQFNQFKSSLDTAIGRAIKAIDQSSSPLLSEIHDYVQDEALSVRSKAKKVPLPRTTKDNFVRAAKKYINGQSSSLRPAAEKAARDWIATGQEITVLRARLANLLDQAKGHAGTVIRSELQTAYVSLVKQASTNLGLGKVRRWVAETACELCKALEGVHDSDSDEAYELPHPNCGCTFHPEATAEDSEADMSKRTNQSQSVDMSDLSHSAIRSLLQAAITKKVGKTNTYIYIRDVFDDYFVYDLETNTNGSYAAKCYQVTYVIDAKRQVTLGDPEEVVPVLSYEPVVSMNRYLLPVKGAHFSNGYIVRQGKIFEAGDYPDKGFELTPEEMQSVVNEFEPVDLDIEHMPTVLDGKLGRLTSISVASDGVSLLGEVQIPEWLHKAIGDTALKVSTTWDIFKKQLVGLALVLDPRVPDAAVFAAFAGRRHAAEDMKDFQAIHDLMVGHGVVCSPDNLPEEDDDEDVDNQTTEEATMAQRQQVTQTTPTTTQPPTGAPGAPQGTPAQAQSDDEVLARLKRLEEENDRLRLEAIEARAATFADQQISDRRAMPADRQSIIDEYVQAAQDDRVTGIKVKFSKGAERVEGTRIEALTTRYAGRPQHNIVGNNQQLRVVTREAGASADDDNQAQGATTMSNDRKVRLMKKTPLGQQTMSRQRSNGTK